MYHQIERLGWRFSNAATACAVARWASVGRRLCICSPVDPSWKRMSPRTCSPKSCMKPSAPMASAAVIRRFHQRTAAGLVKSICAPSRLKFEPKTYGPPPGLVAT